MRFFLIIALLFSVNIHAAEIDDVDTIKKKIEATLKKGDGKEDVESLISKTTWLYSYDDLAGRYQAIPKDGTASCKDRNFFLWLLYDCSIQIFLNVDKSGKYQGYSVEQIYSGL